jgi:dipeptidyl-peptidase-4
MQEEQLWKCGMAIAPVTSWRLYDSAYTERYMRRPQVNEAGYDKADVMHLAANLTGKLLLVHGLADDNVHAQHTWGYVDALVQAGKQFEMQIYPDDNHFIRRGENYQHLHNRLLIFLENNL